MVMIPCILYINMHFSKLKTLTILLINPLEERLHLSVIMKNVITIFYFYF